MPWAPDNLRTKGAKSTFHQRIEAGPTVWDKHVQTETSTTNKETYVWPGFTPRPREFLNSRQFVGMRDFTYDVTNGEHELSMIINRTHWEDDQTGLINARMSEMAEVWSEYKDFLFAALLASGNSGADGYDGTDFHHTDHSAGTVGQTNDNDLTANLTTGTATVDEALTIISTVRQGFYAMLDDVGRPYNNQAIQNVQAIVPTGHERPFVEAMNQTFTTDGTVGGLTNVIGNKWLSGVQAMPQLSAADELYFSALGSDRKGFIYQTRMPLEIEMLTDRQNVALHNGVLVLTRERFVFAFGDFRRSILFTIT